MIDWSDDRIRAAALTLVEGGRVRRSKGLAPLEAAFRQSHWLGHSPRRSVFSLNEKGRHGLPQTLETKWPAWRSTLEALKRDGLAITPESLRQLARAPLPLMALGDLPPYLHHKSWQAVHGPHSKARGAVERPEGLTLTQDGIARLRGRVKGTLAVRGHSLPLSALTEQIGELCLPERSCLNSLAWEGPPPKALMTVENLGAFVDCPLPPGLLLLHVPGWDTRLARRLMAVIPAESRWHFGDLDPEGWRILAHLRAETGQPISWFVPALWSAYVSSHALPAGGGWRSHAIDAPPPLVAQLIREDRWLEQEVILLDDGLGDALGALGEEGSAGVLRDDL